MFWPTPPSPQCRHHLSMAPSLWVPLKQSAGEHHRSKMRTTTPNCAFCLFLDLPFACVKKSVINSDTILCHSQAAFFGRFLLNSCSRVFVCLFAFCICTQSLCFDAGCARTPPSASSSSFPLIIGGTRLETPSGRTDTMSVQIWTLL